MRLGVVRVKVLIYEFFLVSIKKSIKELAGFGFIKRSGILNGSRGI